MSIVSNILVATDFSDASHAALAYARELARTLGARLHLLHVFEAPMFGDLDVDGRVTPLPELRFAMEDAQRTQLDALLTDDDRTALGATTIFRTLDTPAHAVVDYAAAQRIDLIVIGTHGRRGLARMVVGSVAEQVVRTAPCPVLTVRQPMAGGSPRPATPHAAARPS